MTTYTDEVNIYNTEAIGQGITGAGQTASNYISIDPENGIRIADADPSTATTYQRQTASGTEFFVNGVNMADFGGAGARVGAEDGAHVGITSDAMSVTNADGLEWFNVDMDAGSASIASKIAGKSTSLTVPAKTDGESGKLKFSVDVSSIPSGTQFKVNNLRGSHLVFSPYGFSAGWNVSSATVSSNAVVRLAQGNFVSLAPGGGTTAPTYTKGTAGTSRSYSVTGVTGVNGNITVAAYLTISYSGGNSVSFVCDVTVTAASASYAGLEVVFTMDSDLITYTATVTGAALTFGTREGDVGVLSSTFGEGLTTAYQDQTAVGKFNDNKSTNLFEVGNGTSDSARSNAFEVSSTGEIAIGGSAMADFVVEQGTASSWTYRKWKSGIYECWRAYSASMAITTASAAYGGYRSAQYSLAWPVTFSAVPNVQAVMANNSQGAQVVNVGESTTTQLKWYLGAGSSLTSASRTMNIYAIGTVSS